MGDAAMDTGSSPCPAVGGAYTVALTTDNKGCSDLNASAPECIVQTGCDVVLKSVVSAGKPALNGTASLQNDGSFSGAAITEGSLGRTGCIGSWTGVPPVLTVDCGGTNSTQSCVVTLTATNTTCN
jgi:hypothetical protein